MMAYNIPVAVVSAHPRQQQEGEGDLTANLVDVWLDE
jgi:hypothetical protein